MGIYIPIPPPPGSGGSFVNPDLTGTVTFFDGLMTFTSGGDRVFLDAAVFQFKTSGHSRVYIADNHPQLTLQNADLWFEPGDGGARQGSIAALDGDISDFGYSTLQQNDIPGFRPFRHVSWSGTMFWIPVADRSNYTIASTEVMQLQQAGNVSDGTQHLILSNVQGLVLHNSGGSRYLEIYLGQSSIFKMQTNVDFWVNDAKFGFWNDNANLKRIGSTTLVSGTKTIGNASVAAKTTIVVQAVSGGSGPVGTYKVTKVGGTGFTIDSSDPTDNNVVEYVMFEDFS